MKRRSFGWWGRVSQEHGVRVLLQAPFELRELTDVTLATDPAQPSTVPGETGFSTNKVSPYTV